MKVAVVGASGLVGSKMLEVLAERKFPVSELIPVASEKSAGKELTFCGKSYKLVTLAQALAMKPQLAFFAAGGSVSTEWIPKFTAMGVRVVDNSSAWRMDPEVKLVIPEVNAHLIEPSDYLIANPNCSTIQMLVALAPLHGKYKIKRIVVATYQSVTGTGVKAVNQLLNERKGIDAEKVYPYPIDLNVIPQIDDFLPDGYTKEEMKMVNETHKILGDRAIGVSATTVRLPVMGGHSEAINVELYEDFTLEDVRNILQQAPGVVLQDDTASKLYPMPLMAHGRDEVFVGRLRRDESQACTLNLWVVADNLRKGAATNAIQIAEYLLQKGYLS